MMGTMTRKLLSCLLVAMLLVTMLPTTFAQAEQTEEPSAIVTEQPAPEETEPTAAPTEEAAADPTEEPEETVPPEQPEETAPPEEPVSSLTTEILPSGLGSESQEEMAGVLDLNVSISGAPDVTTSAPSATLTANASGLVILDQSKVKYQWYVGGSPVLGETNKTFIINFPDDTNGSKVVKVVATYKGTFSTYTGQASVTINYDRRDLAITNVAFTGGYGGNWTKNSVGISFTVVSTAHPLSTVTVNGTSLPLTGDGNYATTITQEGNNVVTIVATDDASNSVTNTDLRTKIDATAPTIIASANPSGWTNALSVTINANASDLLSGLDKLQYRVDGLIWLDAFGSSWMTITPISQKFEFRAVDHAGNTSDVTTVYSQFDRVDPYFDVSVTPSNWTNDPNGVKITVYNVIDIYPIIGGSGVASVKVGSETLQNDGGNYVYYATAEGKTAYEVSVTDNAGNVKKRTVYTYYDVTAPTYDLSVEPADWTNGVAGVKITLSNVSDDKAGVNEVTGVDLVKIAGQTIARDQDGKYVYICQIEGKTAIDILVEDKIGNQRTETVYAYIDYTGPSFTYSLSEDDWTYEDVTITINDITDANGSLDVSDIASVTVDGSPATWVSDTQYTYVVSAEGAIEHTIVVTDVAGNTTEEKVTTKIDKTAPTATLSSNLVLNPGASWTSQESVTIQVTAQDPTPDGVQGVSGLPTEYVWFAGSNQIVGKANLNWTSSPSLTINFDKSGIYTVYPFVRDLAGNVYPMEAFTVNYVSDDLTITIGSPIDARTTQVEVTVEETGKTLPQIVSPDYYVGPGDSSEHEVTLALTLHLDGANVADPSMYFTAPVTIKMGGSGTVTFVPRLVNDAESGLTWTDYLPAGGIVNVSSVTDSLSLAVIPGTAQSLTFDPVTVDRTEGAITLGFAGTVGSRNWMKDGITINGLSGEVVRILVVDADGTKGTYYKKLENGTATLAPDDTWWHTYDDATGSHNDKTISVGYIDVEDLFNSGADNLIAELPAYIEQTTETFWYMYQAYDNRDVVVTENRGKTIDVDVPEPGMQITSITFDGTEYLAAPVNAGVGTTYTLTEDLLVWWTEAVGPALSGRECPVAVTTSDVAGNTSTTTLTADVSETEIPIKFSVKPDLIDGASHKLMGGRSTVTIKGSANEYETLNVKIGSYYTTVKVGGSGDYELGEKGYFSLTVDTADLKLPKNEPFEMTISYRDIDGKPFSQFVVYDDEIAPILLTMAPNDQLGISGVVEPGSTVQMIYGGVTYDATVDEYGCFTFEGQGIVLVAGEELKIIVTDIFGNTVTRVLTVLSGDTTIDLYTIGKTFLFAAKKDDATFGKLSGFGSEGAAPSETDLASIWFAATPVTQEDFANGAFEIPLLLANQYVVGKVIVTMQDDGTYVASYQIDESLAATVNADSCYLGVAYTGEFERLSTTNGTETAVKEQPKAKDFAGATSYGFETAFTLDYEASAQAWIIAKVQVEIDTINLSGLTPISGALAELYEAYQLNN